MLRNKKPGPWIICAVILIAVIVYFLLNPLPPEGKIPAFQDIQTGYTTRMAERDGCVVFEEWHLISGKNYWDDFIASAQEGKSAMVRLYQAASDWKEGYTVKELHYDGEKYLLFFYHEEEETGEEILVRSEYKFLIGHSYSVGKTHQNIYLLSNSEDATYSDYVSCNLSSDKDTNDSIYKDCILIYYEQSGKR